jgi:hypothetical protein
VKKHFDFVLNIDGVEFRKVYSGFWFKILKDNNAEAIYLPWGVVYFEGYLTKATIAHELVHHKQRLRDGAVLFTLKYLWYNFRYGYHDSPYEIEAYAVSDPLE